MRAAVWLLLLANAAAVPPAPIHALSDAEVQTWIAAAKAHTIGDGATILQALEHAQRERPARFLFGKFSVGYNTRDGEPDAVTVETWIGSKRLAADTNTIMIPVKRADGRLRIAIPRSSGIFLDGLRRGRDALVQAIDEQYADVCIDATTHEKLC